MKPADVHLNQLGTDSNVAIDLVVATVKQNQLVHRTRSFAECRGLVAIAAHDAKMRKYGQLCAAEQITYKPFARDIYGHFTDAAREVISTIASRRALRSNTTHGIEFFRIQQQLSVQQSGLA